MDTAKSAVHLKLERLRAGAKPKVLDLFGGCGGMSLGFQAAGFVPLASVERDPKAAATYSLNFHLRPDGSLDPVHSAARDIEDTEPRTFIASLDPSAPPESLVDILIGGPPCQAYARVGRAKLRQVSGLSDGYMHDSRGRLFRRFLAWVGELQPVAVVMENVPDMLRYGGENLAHVACAELEQMGYEVRYGLINAVHYGVPQLRERLFVIALAKETGRVPGLPSPISGYELPRGYMNVRQWAAFAGSLDDDQYFVKSKENPDCPSPAVTAWQALGDLPRLTGELHPGIRRGPKTLEWRIPYPDGGETPRYARIMRRWKRSMANGVTAHVTRSLPRDYEIFRRMPAGAEYPGAHAIALNILAERLRTEEERGVFCEPSTKAYAELVKAVVPPYDSGKFPNKWWKLNPDRPVRTLTAHIGKDTYSHIHYDNEQKRTITVREAARLQSFPDGFAFAGSMNSAFRQIGNAVPPLLAYAVARSLRVQLGLRPHAAQHLSEELTLI